ncbi:hypothetical protein FQN60_017200 [Etheostoma spectabile]|uniref:Uncharacterized protein n=1 Tax=Etheostoma spectabile TaxID=54343 RepID=A0A5J5DEU8_9PERO|nr:hypothetical protein FQN60_017200 [Etheostoma spectabile]
MSHHHSAFQLFLNVKGSKLQTTCFGGSKTAIIQSAGQRMFRNRKYSMSQRNTASRKRRSRLPKHSRRSSRTDARLSSLRLYVLEQVCILCGLGPRFSAFLSVVPPGRGSPRLALQRLRLFRLLGDVGRFLAASDAPEDSKEWEVLVSSAILLGDDGRADSWLWEDTSYSCLLTRDAHFTITLLRWHLSVNAAWFKPAGLSRLRLTGALGSNEAVVFSKQPAGAAL